MSEFRVDLLVFALDRTRHALVLAGVERVARAVEITALPGAPESVRGIVNVQGRVVPVFDCRQRFGLPSRELRPSDQLIFALARRRRVGLWVDEVCGVISHPADQVLAPEGILSGLHMVRGVVRLPDELLLIHDLDAFLGIEEDAALRNALGHATATHQ